MTRMMCRGSIALSIVFAASPTFAQTDSENIQARVKPAQKVFVTDDQGREFRGRITNLTADGLTIRANGQTADVPYARIVRIDRPGDTLANGALMGFGVGAALGLAALNAGSKDSFLFADPNGGEYMAAGVMGGGVGAAVGAAIDALIRRDREIYRRAGGARTAVAPALGRGVRGVVVSTTW